jgi:hypothetical protein
MRGFELAALAETVSLCLHTKSTAQVEGLR